MLTREGAPALAKAGLDGAAGQTLPIERTAAANPLIDRCVLATLALAILLVGLLLLDRPLKDDIAWLLYLGEQVLDGRGLYTDLIEVNPPLIVGLSLLPVSAGRLFGLSPMPLFLVAAGTLLCLSAGLTASLLRGYSALFRFPARTFAAVAAVLWLLPGPEFGQREHLMIACVLPYLACRARRWQGDAVSARMAVAAGLLAGVGFGLKPHYCLALLLVEMFGLLHASRPLRIALETRIAAGFLVLYAVSIAWFFPGYLTLVVPLASDLYGASDAGLWYLLFEGRYLIIATVVLSALLAFDKCLPKRDPLAGALMALGVGTLLAYLLQDKGWFYHRLPAETAMLLLVAYGIARALYEGGTRRMQRALGALVVLACLLGAMGASALNRLAAMVPTALDPSVTIESRLADLVRGQGAQSLLVLSDELAPAFPVVNMTGVRWTSRFDTMWALRGALGSAATPDAWPVAQWVVDDFLAGRPDLVVVDDRAAIDYLVALRADPRFAAAWLSYRPIAELSGRRVFARTQ